VATADRALPQGTVTLLFTDIEGSTELLRGLGRNDYVAALNSHREILRAAVESLGGVEIEMQGDSFFFAFHSARAAALAAAEAQLRLAQHDWPTLPILVRMGLHTGEPDITDDGRYTGLDIHRAARIMSIGHGGQILLSARTADLVEGDLPPSMRTRPLGTYLLKDFERSEPVSQLEMPGLGTSFPTLRAPVARQRRMGPRAAVAAATIMLAAALAAVLFTRGRHGAGPRENVVVAIDPARDAVSGRTGVGSSPTAIAAGSGGVWAVNAADSTVTELSPLGKLIRTVGTEGSPAAVATAGGFVWVGDRPRTIVRLDPGTAQVTATFLVNVQLSRVGSGLWLASRGRILWATVQGDLVRIDAATGELRVKPLPGPDWGPLAVLGTTIWESQVNNLYHLTASGRILSNLRFPQGPVATDGGYVWAINAPAGVVAEIDPRTSTIVRTVTVGAGPTGLTFGAGSLWVCSQDGTVTRIDPTAGRATATIRVGGSPQGVAAGFGRIWVAVS
jgi:class 3 adenylate cyclase/DNA-binding beta-propeller fold protein YncE